MKFIIQIIGIAVLCYCVIGAVLYFFQEKMLFFPMGDAFGKCPRMKSCNAEAIDSNGIRYYLRKKSSPDNWIVIFHGNAGNACDRTYFFDLLSGFNSNLVIFEYPGYGMDGNSPGEKVICEQALELVSQIRKSESKNLPVYLMGESLGTGVATWASTQTKASGLILVSAYTSIANVAAHHYSWLPVKYLLKHKFQANLWAQETSSPAILFHGSDDDIIPIKFAREQVLNFNNSGELVEIEKCGHNDIVDAGKDIMQEKIRAFILKISSCRDSEKL